MRDPMAFETHLEELFARYAALAPVAVDRSIGERAVATGRGGRPLRFVVQTLSRPAAAMMILALLAVAALVAALVVGSLLNRPERPLGGFTQIPRGRIQFIEMAAGLPDGQVVVVGPTNVSTGPSEASLQLELFDPATDRFRPGPALPEPRRDLFTLTTLSDGRVLLAGGELADAATGATTSSNVVQLFDPKTGRFERTGDLLVPRARHTATLLKDGRVLLTGGRRLAANDDTPLDSAEIYDPQSGTSSSAGSFTTHRSQYTATLLADGRVMVTGGWDDEAVDQASIELYDPATNRFVAAGRLADARRTPGQAVLPDGRVLVVGGSRENAALRSAELYDPTTGDSEPTGSLATARSSPAVVVLPDGHVLVAGGWNEIGEPRSSEIYDPATGMFTAGPFASNPHGVAVSMPDGRVFLPGDHAEVFDPASDGQVALATPRVDRVFVAAGAPRTDRMNQVATKLADGSVLMVGGRSAQIAGSRTALSSAEIYDPARNEFRTTGSSVAPFAEDDPSNTSVTLPDGRVLIVNRQFQMGADTIWNVQAFDPRLGLFDRLGSPITAEHGLTDAPRIVRLASGDLLVLGPPLTPTHTPQAQIYQLAIPNGTVTWIARLDGCRVATQAVVGAGDRIVVLCRGGQDGSGSVVAFDPATRSSTRLAVSIGPNPAALVGLDDGRVLVATGLADRSLAVLDPVTRGVTPADRVPADDERSPLPTPGISLTRLDDGRVLIVTRVGACIWDPVTRTSSVIPEPLARHDGQSATLLDDGRVLIVGGTTPAADAGVPSPPRAELFDPTALP